MTIRTETTDWLGTIDWTAADSAYGYLQPGYTATGILTGLNDVDLIMIPLASNYEYSVEVEGDGVTATIIDDSQLVASGDDLTFTTSHPSKFYFVRLEGSGSYTVHFEGLSSDLLTDEDVTNDQNPNTPNWSSLAVGQSRTGVINGNDSIDDLDYFRTFLQAGTTYRWSMTPAESDYGPTAGAWLQLMDSQGNDISNVYSGSAWYEGTTLEYTPTTSGWYFVEANTYTPFNQSGSYQITVADTADSGPGAELSIKKAHLKAGPNGIWQVFINLELDRDIGNVADVSGAFSLSVFGNDGLAPQVTTGSFDFSTSQTRWVTTIDLGAASTLRDKSDLVLQITDVSNATLDASDAFEGIDLNGIELYGTGDDDLLIGSTGDDLLIGLAGNDLAKGSKGDDVLNGGNGNDKLLGGKHNDKLLGGNGHDKLLGDSGKDVLLGNAGNDRLVGGEGRDILRGGGGADVFEFNAGDGRDKIKDMRISVDHIKIKTGNFGDLTFTTKDANVLVGYDGGSVLVQNVTLADLNDADNFLF